MERMRKLNGDVRGTTGTLPGLVSLGGCPEDEARSECEGGTNDGACPMAESSLNTNPR